MASKIEKMDRMRRNILLIVFVGSLIAFGTFLYPSVHRFFHFHDRPRFDDSLFLYALFVWLAAIFFFTVRYLLYKNTLRKDPALKKAVNDERVKRMYLLMPQIFLTIFLAVLSLVGAFLFYNREVIDG